MDKKYVKTKLKIENMPRFLLNLLKKNSYVFNISPFFNFNIFNDTTY